MTITTSDSTAAFSKAFLEFQGATEAVQRSSTNPHFRSKYASLEAVIDYARPHLQSAGITFTQAPGAVVDGALEVTTRLTHAESGEWQQSTMQIPLAKRDPQGAGSALTYAQRYSLMAALGLPPTDDDAEAAIDRNNQRSQPTHRQNEPETTTIDSAHIADRMIEYIGQIRVLDRLTDWLKAQNEVKAFERMTDADYGRVKEVYQKRRVELRKAEPVNTLEAG